MQAALKGAGEIGFTIVSITLSLIAVFIPLFLMGGYVGLLFREFAVAVSVALVLSLLISLTLTPMMCARLLKPQREQHGRLYRLSERGFDGLLSLYERGLKIVLRHRFITLMVMLGTIVLTGYLYVVIPKGFFPQQDTGLIIGLSEAAQDISFPAMAERQQAVINAVLKDPAVASVGSAIGAGGGTTTLNQGRVFIALKPKQRAQRQRRPGDPAAADASSPASRASRSTCRLRRTSPSADGYQRPSINTRWPTPIPASSTTGRRSSSTRSRPSPASPTSPRDQENAGPLLDITVNREVASSFGILPSTIDNTLDDAFGQRIVSTMYTMNNQYHVVLEVDPKFQFGPEALNNIYVNSSTGQQVPLRTLVNSGVKVAPLVVNHQGQFPSVTISFNLAPGNAIGQAVAAIQQVEKELGKPASLATSFQGNAQAFQSSLASTPLLIAAALVVIYIILGMLYESVIHPITILSTLPSAGIGALLLLMAFHFDLSVIAIVGIILLIGIVKKNGIMLIDFALERRARTRPDLGTGDLPSLRAAFPADPDDHHGGDAGGSAADAWQRRRVGDSPAARLCHRRWSRLESNPDPLHHPGRLPLSGPPHQAVAAAK